MTNSAVAAAGPRTESFASPAGRVLGYIVVGAAVVLILLGLRSQGTGAFGLIGICVSFASIAWVVLIRPRVTIHRDGLLLRNMMRDTFLPWSSIRSCRVAQTLQIGTRDRVYHGLGLSRSARQAHREQRQKRAPERQVVTPNLGMSSAAGAPSLPKETSKTPQVNLAKEEQIGGSYFSHAEERIEVLSQQGAARTSELTPIVSTDVLPIAALALAVVGVLFALFA